MKRFLVLSTILVSLVACAQQKKPKPKFPVLAKALELANAQFNPDTESDSIEFTKLRARLGAVPAVTQPVTLGGVSKAFGNEYWRTLKEGMENWYRKIKQYGCICCGSLGSR